MSVSSMKTTTTSFAHLGMKLATLIATSHGPEAAKDYATFQPNEEQLATLQRVGNEVISIFGPVTHACAPMSAAYTARLEFELKKAVPVFMVAGSLKVKGEWIYGDGKPFDGKAAFGSSNSSWDGHAWVMFGPYVADATVRQTALSGRSHKSLETLVRKTYGEEKGLVVMKWSEAPSHGFYFIPQYVLTDQEVTNVFLGAQRLLGIA
jgi:hypothetical protein